MKTLELFFSSCGSEVEPGSCYQKAAGSIPFGLHVESVLGQDTELQTPPDVLVGTLSGSHGHQCMNV